MSFGVGVGGGEAANPHPRRKPQTPCHFDPAGREISKNLPDNNDLQNPNNKSLLQVQVQQNS